MFDENDTVPDWQLKLLEGCCKHAHGVAVEEGAFAPGPALWVGKREVAHFDDKRTLDVRLTKSVIRDRRAEFQTDDRVTLRRGTSDWLQIAVETDDDIAWATDVIVAAVAANLPTGTPGLPPTGAELQRRRRFH